jgi:hypothetical protein
MPSSPLVGPPPQWAAKAQTKAAARNVVLVYGAYADGSRTFMATPSILLPARWLTS